MKPLFTLALLFSIPCLALQAQNINKEFADYFSANSPKQKEKVIRNIVSLNPSCEDVFQKLRDGRKYSSSVKRGFLILPQEGKILPPNCLIFVPHNYTPDKKYSVRLFLHGGISNISPDFIFHFVDTTGSSFKQLQDIVIYPSAWMLAPWWSNPQFENINRILLWVKKTYNVNENQVRLMGVSDGGTGSYSITNCEVTPWSCVTPFIGSLGVLSFLGNRQVYINNLSNKPFFIVNAGKDKTFPKQEQVPYFNLLQSANPNSFLTWVDSAGHSMRWLSVLSDSIDSFVNHHPRNPYPTQLIWQTDDVKRYGRNHYLVINEIGKIKSEEPIPDYNEIATSGVKQIAYKRDSLSGTVKVIREGNVFHVQTNNVRKYSLLLSSDVIDFKHPVIVYTNKKESFNGLVKPEIKTLLKWNSVDEDREMLFEAELSVRVH